MPAIFQPLKGGKLLERLGFGRGRIIFEDGKAMEFLTRDWAKSRLDQYARRGLATDGEVTDLKDSLGRSNVAASMDTIRDRVAAMARDLPPDFDTGGISFEACASDTCSNPFFHGMVKKGGIAADIPVQTFSEGMELLFNAVESEEATPDQAIHLLGQMGEMPLDDADCNKRLDALPEEKKAEITRRAAENRKRQIEAIGSILLTKRGIPGLGQVTIITLDLSSELAE